MEIGRNVEIEYRWTAGDATRARQDAVALAELKPDVILTNGAAGVTPCWRRHELYRSCSCWSLIRSALALSTAWRVRAATLRALPPSKWLWRQMSGTSKGDCAPCDAQAVVRDPTTSVGIGLFGAIQSAAPSLRMETTPINVRDAEEIERALIAFASVPNGGLVVTASPLAFLHRELIIGLAAGTSYRQSTAPGFSSWFGVLRDRHPRSVSPRSR